MTKLPTLSDLIRDNQRLELWCCSCAHEVLMSPAEAVAKFGDVPFKVAARRCVCAKCGAKGRDDLIGARPSVNDMYRAMGMTATHAQGEDAWRRKRL